MLRKTLLNLNTTNSLYLFQTRFYRGKYYTSYQQKIATNSHKRPFVLLEHRLQEQRQPDHILAQMNLQLETENICDDKRQLESTEIDRTTRESGDTDLIKAAKLFACSSDEYRKLLFYGTENPEIKSSAFDCHGCGSNLNCESIDNRGYIPWEIFQLHRAIDEESMRNLLCVRCFLLENDLDPLDISLDRDVYRDVVRRQLDRYDSGVLIVVADMADLPFSIPTSLELELHSLGPDFRVVLVGNKSDLLGKVDRNAVWYEERLVESAIERGIPRDRIEFTHLISARTCHRVESLIDRILCVKFYRNEPIFLIGSMNSGKSSIFNMLLKSDLCKSIAKRYVKSALISNLPGTTINVLRFPMTNLSRQLLNRRKEAKLKLSEGSIASAVSSKYPILNSDQLKHDVSRTQLFDELVTYSYTDHGILANAYDKHSMRLEFDKSYHFDESKITTNKWFYDTPGLVNPDQLISYLTKEDIDKLYSTDPTIPKIFILKTGLSIILQNLGRVDIIEATQQLYFCVHARLPVEIVETNDIDRYFAENDHFTLYSFKENLSLSLIERIKSVVPDYNPEDSLLPAMVPVDMEFKTTGFNVNSADVVLSSIGWVSISGAADSTCKIRAWTPAAIGCTKRIPSLIPNSIKRRGHRKPFSREFSID